MNSVSYFRLLVDYDHWATLRVVNTVLSLGEIPPKAEVLINHLTAAGHHWYCRIIGESPKMEIWDKNISPDTWREQIDSLHDAWAELLEREGELNRRFTYKNSRGHEFTNTLWEVLTHLTLHSQYHRGQIITTIRPFVDQAPATDMIVYLRESSASM
ncbi:MAG: DinB family protein [Crocinitomicaceae bacterium]|nr:DinB family protein [Crocinitomicaceae bacterium]